MMTRDYAAPDWRGLCSRMADELDHHRQLLTDDRREVHPLAVEARAALAQPEPEVVDGVTSDYIDPEHTGADRDMLEVFYSACRSEGGTADEIHLRGLRAVLARWGRPAPAPAEGEVAELVAWLRANALTVQKASGNPANGAKQRMNRAAAMLEERHPAPVPVAVSERLPGPEDCLPWPGEPNAGRWCWMASCVDNGWAWEQRTLGFLASFPQDFTHWLPATALPLPSGEVQP